jgi:hypothetical protein
VGLTRPIDQEMLRSDVIIRPFYGDPVLRSMFNGSSARGRLPTREESPCPERYCRLVHTVCPDGSRDLWQLRILLAHSLIFCPT